MWCVDLWQSLCQTMCVLFACHHWRLHTLFLVSLHRLHFSCSTVYCLYRFILFFIISFTHTHTQLLPHTPEGHTKLNILLSSSLYPHTFTFTHFSQTPAVLPASKLSSSLTHTHSLPIFPSCIHLAHQTCLCLSRFLFSSCVRACVQACVSCVCVFNCVCQSVWR